MMGSFANAVREYHMPTSRSWIAVLALPLALSLQPAAWASLASDTFKDVPNGHWAEQGIAEVAIKRDLMKGYPDGTFRGETPFTRFQFADSLSILIRDFEALSKVSWRPAEHPLNSFADVPAGPERDEVLSLANDYGLFEGIPGISADKFDGDKTVTRYEMAHVINRLMQLAEAKDVVRPVGKPNPAKTFKDFETGSWAGQDVLDVSQKYHVMVGFPDGAFRGGDELTRYQYAQAISQTFPLIPALIQKTVEVKKEEKRQLEGPWRFQEREPIHFDGSYGPSSGGGPGGLFVPSISGRYISYPNGLVVLSDTRIQPNSGALAGQGGQSTGGTMLDETLGLMVQTPLWSGIQVQPYLGLRGTVDWSASAGNTYGFLGPNAGVIGYWRPVNSPLGYYAKGGLSWTLLGGNSGPAAFTNTPQLPLTGEVGIEYHVAPRFAVLLGLGTWQVPTGYLAGNGVTGVAGATGLNLGLNWGF